MSMDTLKQLRAETGISMMECKKALDEAGGDIDRAKKLLRERGKEMSNKKSGRTASAGMIHSYIHPGAKIGVLLELQCETDFVAKADDFKTLAHEICIHIAATAPQVVREEDISEDLINAEKEIYMKQFEGSGKPENVIESIIEGKLKKYREEIVLLSQSFVKDPDKKVKDLVEEYTAKLGERLEVGKFVRFEI